MTIGSNPRITIRFALPSEQLRPFVTTYYQTIFEGPVGEWVEDYFHPEWANLRMSTQSARYAANVAEELQPSPAFTVSGPSSRATRFAITPGHSWGIGLMPLGWAKLIAEPAGDYANRTVDGMRDETFAGFVPLAHKLIGSSGDFEAERQQIDNHLVSLLGRAVRQEKAIKAINAALVDSTITSVTELADRTGMTVRTLERNSNKAFGFAPKLLLRRQRFLRSLAQFMLDPSMRWLGAIDSQFHDQAHFTREFRHFMGMTPSEYSKLEHPILSAAAPARAAIAGEAVQALHDPK